MQNGGIRTQRVSGNRILKGYWKHKNLRVSKTNLGTWAVHRTARFSPKSAVKIGNQVHFWTLKELHSALNRAEWLLV